MGLFIVLLVSAAWGTGLWYLMARLGLPSPIRLAWMDGVHAYVGLVGGIFVAAKVARVGLRYRVRGVAGIVRWQRWVSWSLLVLYSLVFVTGVLALLPIRGRLYGNLVDLHLISSVWALLPTSWHVWHYRRLAAPYLTRLRAPRLRFWAGLGLALIPAAWLLLNARGVSQLPLVKAGSAWSQVALSGDYLDRLAIAPDGSLVAAGDSVYVSRDGVVWVRLDLPPGPAGTAPEPTPQGEPAVHQHGPAPSGNLVLSLSVTRGGIYAGTKNGVAWTPNADIPLTVLGLSGSSVRALAADPTDQQALWAASSTGLMFSDDGGHTWTARGAGLEQGNAVAALGYFKGQLYASDGTGVFVWNGASGTWARSSSEAQVVDLTAGPQNSNLYASSATQGVWRLSAGGWEPLAAPAASHQHHGHLHGGLSQLTVLDGRLYASGTSDGVSASADGGLTWTQLGGGLPPETPPTDVIPFRGGLLAANPYGLYRFSLSSSNPASPTWWFALVAAAVLTGTCAIAIAGTERLPRFLRRRRHPDGDFASGSEQRRKSSSLRSGDYL